MPHIAVLGAHLFGVVCDGRGRGHRHALPVWYQMLAAIARHVGMALLAQYRLDRATRGCWLRYRCTPPLTSANAVLRLIGLARR